MIFFVFLKRLPRVLRIVERIQRADSDCYFSKGRIRSRDSILSTFQKQDLRQLHLVELASIIDLMEPFCDQRQLPSMSRDQDSAFL